MAWIFANQNDCLSPMPSQRPTPPKKAVSSQVSFYILPDDTLQARGIFACRLAEKAWNNGVKSHIHMASAQELKVIDELLWSFREDSFLPHTMASESTCEPITLGTKPEQLKPEQLSGKEGLLINLGSSIPDNLDHFARIAEIVVQDADILEQARVRFRQYKERGMTPMHQKIGKKP